MRPTVIFGVLCCAALLGAGCAAIRGNPTPQRTEADQNKAPVKVESEHKSPTDTPFTPPKTRPQSAVESELNDYERAQLKAMERENNLLDHNKGDSFEKQSKSRDTWVFGR